jgi:hypothetical protein
MRVHAVGRGGCIQGQQEFWGSTWRGGVEVKAVLDSVHVTRIHHDRHAMDGLDGQRPEAPGGVHPSNRHCQLAGVNGAVKDNT